MSCYSTYIQIISKGTLDVHKQTDKTQREEPTNVPVYYSYYHSNDARMRPESILRLASLFVAVFVRYMFTQCMHNMCVREEHLRHARTVIVNTSADDRSAQNI